MSARLADAVIADAIVIADYYRDRFSLRPQVIPYGSEFPAEPDSDVLRRLSISPRKYVLYVSRFEPENNPLEVVEAYERFAAASGVSPTPLVMVGQALYAKGLAAELQRHRGDRILFPGAIYGPDYRTLQRNALLYIHATEVGGTHPAMIEAMASGGAVVALGTPENREVGGDAAGYFEFRPEETLSRTVGEWLGDRDRLEHRRQRGRARAAERFRWDSVTAAYEALFREISS
jgi:glycosyltransferase involved in cell wall biosynthesis